MRKQLIKKFQNSGQFWNDTTNISNQLMQSAGMNFSQPSTFSSGLFNSKIQTDNNLALPSPNIGNVLSNAGLGIPKSPNMSKLNAKGVSTLNNASIVQPKNTGGVGNFLKGNMGAISSIGGVGNFLKGNMGAISSIGGGLFDTAGSMLGKSFDDGATDAVVGVASNVASMFGPWGQAAGLAFKGLNFLDKALGKSTKSVNINSGISGYSGSDLNYKGKDFRFSQNRSRKREIRQINKLKKTAAAGKFNAQDQQQQLAARNQAIGNVSMTNQTQLAGGQDYSVLTAKKGATLQDIRNYIKVRNIEKEVAQNSNLDDNLEKIEIQKFQNGGNLIPSGALHKNKHNLESINSDLDGEITKKGIPVISYAEEGDILEYESDGKTPKILAEGGEVIQHAEIEKDEVILNLSLTKKLVELMKKDTPEAMIEAGKILARELMENTTDNTGLIEKTIGNED